MSGVSVIISVYSKARLGYLLDCIESLRKQSVKPDEIVVVLDPDPGLTEFYRSTLVGDVKIVVSGGYGLSNARNAGVRSVNGEIVAFIDDDAVADRHWLMNLLKSYERPGVVGVGGLIKPLWEGGCPKWFPEELNWVVGCSYKGLPESKAFVRNPIGCNMSFRRSVFEKAGYFKSEIGRFGKKLLAGEETEFSIRILQKIPNSKIISDPSAVVRHRVEKSRTGLNYLWRRSFYEGVSKALIVNLKKEHSAILSTEDYYLKYLLRIAIPARLKKAYNLSDLCQLVTLLFSLSAVILGFFAFRLGRGM
jgi:glycosyltransferase involved in cell wall biosynthesis